MTSSTLSLATDLIFQDTSLDVAAIGKILSILQGPKIDGGELYFQSCTYESWYLEDSHVKSGSYSFDRGVGIRAISGDKTGYAYSDNLVIPALEQAALAARSIAFSGSDTSPAIAIPGGSIVSRYQPINPLTDMDSHTKIALLESIDQCARQEDSRVTQVNASLTACFEVVMILNQHGERVADVRPMVSMHVSVVVEDAQGKRESARSGGGGRVGYDFLIEKERALGFAKEAVRQALVNLEARPAPAGMMPVILGPGWPGVLLHEAVGHGLEGDFNRKGLSAFSGRMGEQVASRGVTVVDDGTLPDRRGSLSIDDEGTPTQCTTLIEDGVLVNYMQDKLNAKLMGMQSTGNCRRESYAHVPMPRMTNTYMLAGHFSPEEMIASVEQGIYAKNFDGGQVDITSGQFVFATSEAYLIEKGKITAPVKGVMLIGNGPEVMQKISMVGKDLMLDPGIGVCGKDGQSVPVGVGQPTLKIDMMTVGGTDQG
ncbi:MAG: metalloprotease TldD [Gammaproteobacteria bacterium]|nr:metalloprotease TldD [Gammaproteobacteria bacterium]